VVATHLEELGRCALRLVGELLVEHHEALVVTVAPPEVHGPTTRRLPTVRLRELLDLVGRDPQPDDVPVEAERHVHVPDTDGDV
jgi:hypothetical protein